MSEAARNDAGRAVQIALRYLELGRTPQALDALHGALSADPNHVGAWCVKARCHLHLDELKNAHTAITRALELNPNSAMALRLSATYQARIGYRDGAIAAAQRAAAVAPNDAANMAALAEVYAKCRDRPASRGATDVAIRLDPQRAATYQSAGLAALEFNDLRSARRFFVRERELDAGSWIAHNNLGVVCSRRANDIGALFHFGRSVAINPQQVPVANLERTARFAQLQIYTFVVLALSILAVVASVHRHVQLWLVGTFVVLCGLTVFSLRRLPLQIRRAVTGTAIPALGASSIPGLLVSALRKHLPSTRLQVALDGTAALLTLAIVALVVTGLVAPALVPINWLKNVAVVAGYQAIILVIGMLARRRRQARPSTA